MVENSTSNAQGEKRRLVTDLLPWLALISLILSTMFVFGQLALLVHPGEAGADTRSRLFADYQPWAYNLIPPINIAAFINDIQKEQALLGTPTPEIVETGVYWVPPTATQELLPRPTNTLGLPPTRTATQRPPASPTPTRSITQTKTATRTIATLTALPSATATATATRTSLPPTRTFTVPPQPTITQTNTQAPTRTFTPVPPTVTITPIPVTRTFTPLPPTFTFTATAVPPTKVPPTPVPPTPVQTTYTAVRPKLEQSKVSSDIPGGCQASFGYTNENRREVDIPLGPRNTLSNDNVTTSTGLPTHFSTGQVSGALQVTWDSGASLTWMLDGRAATANWCSP